MIFNTKKSQEFARNPWFNKKYQTKTSRTRTDFWGVRERSPLLIHVNLLSHFNVILDEPNLKLSCEFENHFHFALLLPCVTVKLANCAKGYRRDRPHGFEEKPTALTLRA
jgi:hypothetical protein